MMPVIIPLRIPTAPLTEYQKEQERFAEMEVELRARRRRAAFGWLRRTAHALRPGPGGWAPGRGPKHAGPLTG